MTSDLLQRELIIDHYRNPRHKGLLTKPDVRHHDRNPFCGDEVTIDLRVDDGLIVDAAFDGRGCSISQATASILVEKMIGSSLDVVVGWDQQFVLDLLGIEIGPVRIKCALLPLNVLQAAIDRINLSPQMDTDGHGLTQD